MVYCIGCEKWVYHIVLDNESSKFFSFSSPFGIFRIKILTFGVSSAPEIFQKLMYMYFGDIKGVVLYFDDLLTCAQTKEEHNVILKMVVKRARSFNIKFNVNKIQYFVNEVRYIRFIFNEEGIRHDKEGIELISNLKVPRNRK